MTASGKSPLWRRVFDDVERAIGRPLTAVTSSTELHAAALRVRRAGGVVSRPVQSIAGLGLHVAGLPSPAEVRELRRQLAEVQREVSAIRREQVQSEREQRSDE